MAIAEPPGLASESTPTTRSIPAMTRSQPSTTETNPTDSHVRVVETPDGIAANQWALLYESQAFFMAHLVDEAGNPWRVDEHHEEWATLAQTEMLLDVMA